MIKHVAVVSGGARGIGLATAERLARDGYRVLTLDINPDVVTRAEELTAQGFAVEGKVVDVSKRADIETAIAHLPHIDAVVCVAGMLISKTIEDHSDADFQRTFGVNVFGSFMLAQAALRVMSGGGRIVLVASRAVLGDKNIVAYASSKAAIVGMVRAMAFELRDRLITVNAVAPGFTDTAMIRELGASAMAASAEREARGRAAYPHEIAPPIVFLASPEAAFVTGQTLFVDAGKSLGGFAGAI